MEQDVAKLIIAAGFLIGLVFWLIALSFYRKMASGQTVERIEAQIPGKSPGEAMKDLIAGGRLFSPQARITRPADNRVTVSQAGIEVHLEAAHRGGGTLMIAEIDDSAFTRRFALGLGAFVLILMPPVVAGVPLALWHYVAPSETPAIRWQSVQVLQIVHVLWPPFMIYFMWRGIRNRVINSISNVLVLAESGA